MLDLEMASAVCPACSITHVGANSYVGANPASLSDLAAAVRTAAGTGAKVISNSYGGSEFRGEQNSTGAHDIAGVIDTISSGDSGYGVEFPAAAGGRRTVAAGGTSLTLRADGTRNTETVWSGGGQRLLGLHRRADLAVRHRCARRTVADVAAVPTRRPASPSTTATAAPAEPAGTCSEAPAWPPRSSSPTTRHRASRRAGWRAPTLPARRCFDVVAGSNGRCKTSVAHLCSGRTGYDGPTGLDTPNGTLG